MRLCRYDWEPLFFLESESARLSYDLCFFFGSGDGEVSLRIPSYKDSSAMKDVGYLNFLLPPALRLRPTYHPTKSGGAFPNDRAKRQGRVKRGAWFRRIGSHEHEFFYFFRILNLLNFSGRAPSGAHNFRVEDPVDASRNSKILNIDDMSDLVLLVNSSIHNQKQR